MKIERFFYGMVDDKIILLKTERVNELLSDANFQFLRKLTPNDSTEWWLPAEQLVALSHVETVTDGNGREWVQNQTLLIPIHDYIKHTHKAFTKHFTSALRKPPEMFEPIMVET